MGDYKWPFSFHCVLIGEGLAQGFSAGGGWTSESASPGNLLASQILRPRPGLLIGNSGVEPSSLPFNKSSRYFFKKNYLFIFRERGREEEREGEKHQCVVASHVAPTQDLAHNPGVCPDWESN